MLLLTSPTAVMRFFACRTRRHFIVVYMPHQYMSTASTLLRSVYEHPGPVIRAKKQPVVKERVVATGLAQVQAHFVLEFAVTHQRAPRETVYAVRHFACDFSTLFRCQGCSRWCVYVNSWEGGRVRLCWRGCIARRHECHALLCLGVHVSCKVSIVGPLFT